jgi:hypothetical protein
MTVDTDSIPQGLVLGELPDKILDFHGSAEKLAQECALHLPNVGLPQDDQPNKRLIHHYVQLGVIDRPDAQGFGAQHVFDFLAARVLLKDGWSLSKIAELRASRPDGLTSILPSVTRGETPAQAAVRQIKQESRSYQAPVAPSMATNTHVSASQDYTTAGTLGIAAEISQRRRELQASLAQMGNPGGRIERRRTLELTLTPWCTVHIDASALAQATPELLEQIGKALTQALHEERIRGGK